MRRAWVLGFIFGPLAGVALLVAPTPGLALGVLVALVLLRARGMTAIAGMLCGTGVSGLARLAQATARCTSTYFGSYAPNVIPPVVLAAGLSIARALLTPAVVVQTRAR